jgi:hypothetical protein
MESRKRALSHEDEPATVKKRIVSAANGSPRVNGMSVEPEESDLGKNLEVLNFCIVQSSEASTHNSLSEKRLYIDA